MAKLAGLVSPLQVGLVDPDTFNKLLEHSYLIVSEAYQKTVFFHQDDRRASSTLILLDLIKNHNSPISVNRYKCPKKGRPANNLLHLPADKSWTNQTLKWEGDSYKSFDDWGAHSVHVSDLLTFRSSFFQKYSYDLYKERLCYDREIIDLSGNEYWSIILNQKVIV